MPELYFLMSRLIIAIYNILELSNPQLVECQFLF